MYNPIRELSDICIEFGVPITEAHTKMEKTVSEYLRQDYDSGLVVDWMNPKDQYLRFFQTYKQELQGNKCINCIKNVKDW